MLSVQNITKTLPNGLKILKGISFQINEGELVGILGPSGAGKTMTMKCLNGLIKPTSGNILLKDDNQIIDITQLSKQELQHVRRKLGVIFQGFHLVKRLIALENVMIGRLGSINTLRSLLYGFTDDEANEAMAALERVKIKKLAFRRVETMSGGEMQRVAIARAIFQNPLMLLADEPIANLDPNNARKIMNLLRSLSSELPIIAVFHQPEIAAEFCTRIIAIKSGQVVYDGDPKVSQKELQEIYMEDSIEMAHLPEGEQMQDFGLAKSLMI